MNVNYLFCLLIPLKLGYKVLVVLQSRTHGESMKIITPHLGCVFLDKTLWAIPLLEQKHA